tara:strand:+ start:6 stop:500 length:495 start_codon:yes stop_codon:yes gene_type:complete
MIQALLIVTVIMTGFAAFLGNGWLQAKEQLGALNTALQAQQIEVKKAKETNDKLVKDFAAKALAHHKSQIERRFENAKHGREMAALQRRAQKAEDAGAKYPNRLPVYISNRINRGMWLACKSSRAQPRSDCKLSIIKTPKAGRSNKPKGKPRVQPRKDTAKPAP